MTDDDKTGSSVDDPQVVNLVNPLSYVVINGMRIDTQKFNEAVEKLGGLRKYDIASIDGYRNAKNELVPDYDSVRIEKRAKWEELQ